MNESRIIPVLHTVVHSVRVKTHCFVAVIGDITEYQRVFQEKVANGSYQDDLRA